MQCSGSDQTLDWDQIQILNTQPGTGCVSYKPSVRLPLLSNKLVITSPAPKHSDPFVADKL